ncbi:uncharacterized protein BXZ73DRAFT_91166 [Epithele typhae]|uniref:uncharacterized protein n=1 Tax=Epithele typhae TaxID=378194 RepID=UPI0020072A96|nr:uncharacterized protein BXZ73DRAFT_91166 [Epithele typhae]KAH9924988.1 hypothetical protein BXZ73DRAFT_91166 [Epithele typhae]
MISHFNDLPLELLPLIVQYLLRPSHLAIACRVNRSFYTFSIPLLYERVFIYAWHKEGKAKVIKLFKTLADYPHLAKLVQQLGMGLLLFSFPPPSAMTSSAIRDFPKALQTEDYDLVLAACLDGIRNCVNLRACTWTRHGSLTSSVLSTLVECSRLQELEINGEHAGFYDPAILPRFTHLRKLSLIMPSAAVASMLLPWCKNTSGTLQYLSVICQSSPRINDEVVASIAPYVTNLEYIYFVGCPKLTHDGLWTLLSGNYKGVVGLGMEGLSTAFDMHAFSELCTHHNTLSRLRSITLTVDEHTALDEWQKSVLALLSHAPLQQFHISTVGGHVNHRLDDAFCAAVVSAHGSRITRFSVHRMRMTIDAIMDICRRCVVLEQLFIVVEQDDLDALGPCLAQAPKLRAVHINRPLDFGSEDVPKQSLDLILSIARQCRPTVRQFGFNTRVFQVDRNVHSNADGTTDVNVALSSYEIPEIPEQFLVVRT